MKNKGKINHRTLRAYGVDVSPKSERGRRSSGRSPQLSPRQNGANTARPKQKIQKPVKSPEKKLEESPAKTSSPGKKE